ncbi:unnamed protein product [Caenorhabditis angaria]|uniref:Uncharacterized protein n=1 Tax=Caenorhabditis angaria TaxID=860376 RepID=A0A9P1IYZ6_9PELO|nr:unnamed protein product [Caenorhabditis angaria]
MTESDQVNRIVRVEQSRHYRIINNTTTTSPILHSPLPLQTQVPIRSNILVAPAESPIILRDKKKWNMLSARTFSGIVFCIRIFILVLAIVSMILILTAPGACFSRYINGQSISREICPGQNSIFPMNADRWSNALHFQGRGQNVYGQVALICITLAFALITVGLSCVALATGNVLTYPQIAISLIALIAFIVSGGVETWYATGFDHMEFFIQAVGNGVFSGCAGLPGCQIQFVVKGWAVAAAFFFLAALLYVLDIALVFISRDKEVVETYAVTTTRY